MTVLEHDADALEEALLCSLPNARRLPLVMVHVRIHIDVFPPHVVVLGHCVEQHAEALHIVGAEAYVYSPT
jgi:hypothetical protein